MGRYILPMMKEENGALVKYFYKLVGSTFEEAVFIFIGIALFGFDHEFRCY